MVAQPLDHLARGQLGVLGPQVGGQPGDDGGGEGGAGPEGPAGLVPPRRELRGAVEAPHGVRLQGPPPPGAGDGDAGRLAGSRGPGLAPVDAEPVLQGHHVSPVGVGRGRLVALHRGHAQDLVEAGRPAGLGRGQGLARLRRGPVLVPGGGDHQGALIAQGGDRLLKIQVQQLQHPQQLRAGWGEGSQQDAGDVRGGIGRWARPRARRAFRRW